MIRLEGKSLEKLIPLCSSGNNISMSVLTNQCSGWALADNADTPACATLFHAHLGFIHYFGTEPDESTTLQIAQEAINYRSDRPFVGWVDFAECPADIVTQIINEFPKAEVIERTVWEHDTDWLQSAPEAQLEDGVRIVPITQEDFTEREIKFETLLFWDRSEDMLENAIGFKAINEAGEFLGQCCTVASVNGGWEIGISTEESHYRQEIAYAMAKEFIKTCYEHGKKPDWDCLADNASSIALAKKLGFREVRSYKLLSWLY